MAIEKQINIVVKEVGLSKVQKDVNKLDASLDNLSDTQKDLSKSTDNLSSSVLDNGGAMGLLNDATGGLAMSVKDAVEATALFSKGSKAATAITTIQTFVTNGATIATKALRVALISTGIGAIVVLISALVVAMSNMKSSAEKAEHAQKLLNDEIERSNQLLSAELSDIDYVTKALVLRAETQGKSTKEIQAIENNASKERLAALKAEEERLLKAAQDKSKTPEQAKAINDALIKNTAAFNKEIQSQELDRLSDEKDIANKKREDEKKAIEDAKTKKDKANQDEIVRIEKVKKQREDEINSFKEFSKVIEEQEEEKRVKELIRENEKSTALENEILAKVEAEKRATEAKQIEADKQIALDNQVKDAKVDIAMQTLSLISEIAGKGSKIGKALAIAQATISGVQGVQNAFTTASASPVTSVFPAYPFIQAGLAGAFSALQIAKIAKGEKANGGESGGGGGGSAPSAPSFNLVQGTLSNQIAQSVGKQMPIKTYVVSRDVSDAQSLDRNIVKSASL